MSTEIMDYELIEDIDLVEDSYISGYDDNIQLDNSSQEVNVNKPLVNYLVQIGAEQIKLSKDTEKDCIKRYRLYGDKNARDLVIKNNLKFVVYMCKPRFKTWSEPLELVSIGNEALIRAIDAFDYTSNTDFRTYAGRAIQRAMDKHMGMLNGIVLPDETMRLRFHINKLENELRLTELDRNITSKKIADILNSRGVRINKKEISVEDVDLVRKFDTIRSVNEVISQDTNSLELGDSIVDENMENEFSRIEDRVFIDRLMDRLTKQEKQVIYLRYIKSFTNEKAGLQLGFSRQRVDQIEKKAMKKMRIAAKVAQ